MIPITNDALLQYLKGNQFDAQLQNDTNQLAVILNIIQKEFPLFLKIFEESGLLQLLVFMPAQIKDGTQNDLARLMHLINKELDIPGFGMDENTDTCFYRIMLPTVDMQIDTRLLESYLKSIQIICEQIAPSILAVATGIATFQEILQKAQNGR